MSDKYSAALSAIPKLAHNGKNYHQRLRCLDAFLATKGLSAYLVNSDSANADSATAWKEDRKALAFLRLSLSEIVWEYLPLQCTACVALWTLHQRFRTASDKRSMPLLKQRSDLCMQPGEEVAEVFLGARRLRNDIQDAGGSWTAPAMRAQILLALPETFGAFVPTAKQLFDGLRNTDGSISRFKARLAAKGLQQKPGVDYEELFAPTTRYASLRAMAAVAADQNLSLHQLDVKTAFLNGKLEEELIYGLKQVPRCWPLKLVEQLSSWLGYEPSAAVRAALFVPRCSCRAVRAALFVPRCSCRAVRAALFVPRCSCRAVRAALFVPRTGDHTVRLLCHVDDLIVAAPEQHVPDARATIGGCFEIRDLGPARHYLGLEIMQCQRKGTVSLSQPGYIQKLLDRHSLQNAKRAHLLPVTDTDTLLDDPNSYRALLALGVLRYLSGTRSFGLCFGGSSATDGISGYCDPDWAGDPQTRRSTTSYAFILNGAAISWSSQLQPTVAASSVEAEYQAASAAVREALWLRKLTPELGLALRPITISLDSLVWLTTPSPKCATNTLMCCTTWCVSVCDWETCS
ncbi:hypothetical protein GPECTOR_301g818 [Gonium pectorale]|uniref:Reverse transcriptase Ty1/copia-type domain-containing protein n=1 Tax=Gonium pectorale TaxID=33097 RepID=A0A150FVT9_GONPE|nr:hypothetical protein GPECTOR_301g818 [Gonium pectorale]|eukprot:KXZ41734.1 hypothetical protein GPECTOR_301g818 [Gonium pectorale]